MELLAIGDDLMAQRLAMAEHLLILPPASRVNTVHMMRQMRPWRPRPLEQGAWPLYCMSTAPRADLIESCAALAEKRRPNFKGWDKPADRHACRPSTASRAELFEHQVYDRHSGRQQRRARNPYPRGRYLIPGPPFRRIPE